MPVVCTEPGERQEQMSHHAHASAPPDSRDNTVPSPQKASKDEPHQSSNRLYLPTPAPPAPPDVDLKHQFFLFMDASLAERIAEMKAHHTKQIAEVLAAKAQAEERAAEQEKIIMANERTIAELRQRLKSRAEELDHALRQTEEKERLISDVQRALDRVHTTGRQLEAQAREANKIIFELHDEHKLIRSALETARSINPNDPVELQSDRGGVAATQTQADSVRILEGISPPCSVDAPSSRPGRASSRRDTRPLV